jgi:hypothetical protein
MGPLVLKPFRKHCRNDTYTSFLLTHFGICWYDPKGNLSARAGNSLEALDAASPAERADLIAFKVLEERLMKTSLLFLSVFALMGILVVSPASAGTMGTMCSGADNVYCNGTGINGNVDAWTINFGYVVSDSFTVGAGTVTGADFGVWLFPGDTVTGIGWSVTSAANGGTVYGSGTAAPVLGPADECGGGSCDLLLNNYGYDIQSLEFSFPGGINLAGGTYWLNLQNAAVPSGDPVYWDENSGPSSAAESAVGSIASEAFAIDGGTGTPEPGTLAFLGGAGLLLLGGALRRKLLNR